MNYKTFFMAISIAHEKKFFAVIIHFITSSRSVGKKWKEENESQYSFISVDEIPVFSSTDEAHELMYVVHGSKNGLTPFFATFERSVAEGGCLTLQERFDGVDFSSVSFIEKYTDVGDLTPIHYVFSK